MSTSVRRGRAMGAQIPVSKSLHGAQNEKTVYNLGLTWGLGR